MTMWYMEYQEYHHLSQQYNNKLSLTHLSTPTKSQLLKISSNPHQSFKSQKIEQQKKSSFQKIISAQKNNSINKKMYSKYIFLTLLLFTVHSIQVCDQFPLDQMINYELCAQWKGDTCVQCATGSYFNAKGICTNVDPLCQVFSLERKACEKCYEGYRLQNGACVVVNDLNDLHARDPLCASWTNGRCIKCSPRSFRNQSGICEQVSPDCNRYSQKNGACLSCYNGFALNNGKCLPEETAVADPLCAQWNGNICIKCAYRSYRNAQIGRCVNVDDLCKTFTSTGECGSCYKGYDLLFGKCIISQTIQTKIQQNPLCSQWRNNQCTKCSHRSYLNKQKICTQVDPYCQNYDQITGTCYSCYKGYQLQNGKCGLYQKIPNTKLNPLCSLWKEDVCVRCAHRAYFYQVGLCKEVDPYCKEFSYQARVCLECYMGYVVAPNGVSCLLYTQAQVALQYERPFQATVQPEPSIEVTLQPQPVILATLQSEVTTLEPEQQRVEVTLQPEVTKLEPEQRIEVTLQPEVTKFEPKQCVQVTRQPIEEIYQIIEPEVTDQVTLHPEQPEKQKQPSSQDPNETECATRSYGICIGCNEGSALTAAKTCRRYDERCLKFNALQWICEKCSGDLMPIGDRCLFYKSWSNFVPESCLHWSRGRCLKCRSSFVLTDDGRCVCREAGLGSFN